MSDIFTREVFFYFRDGRIGYIFFKLRNFLFILLDFQKFRHFIEICISATFSTFRHLYRKISKYTTFSLDLDILTAKYINMELLFYLWMFLARNK